MSGLPNGGPLLLNGGGLPSGTVSLRARKGFQAGTKLPSWIQLELDGCCEANVGDHQADDAVLKTEPTKPEEKQRPVVKTYETNAETTPLHRAFFWDDNWDAQLNLNFRNTFDIGGDGDDDWDY